VVIGSAPEGGGAALIVAVAKDSGLHAGELLGLATKLIQGGGGKDASVAVAGGKNGAGVDDALVVIRDAMRTRSNA
jgi:hypothetical protein